MRSSLRVGLTVERAYRVNDDQTVHLLLPESAAFGVLPRVLATGYLVGLVEWTCMDAVAAHLDADERSLGVHFDISHEAPTPPGGALTIRAKLTAVDRRRLTFDVLAKDDQPSSAGARTNARSSTCAASRSASSDRRPARTSEQGAL